VNHIDKPRVRLHLSFNNKETEGHVREMLAYNTESIDFVENPTLADILLSGSRETYARSAVSNGQYFVLISNIRLLRGPTYLRVLSPEKFSRDMPVIIKDKLLEKKRRGAFF